VRYRSLLLVLLLGAVADSAAAQESYTFTAGIAGGLGGAFDLDDSQAFDHSAAQLSLGMYTADRTLTSLRAGRLSFGTDVVVDNLTDAELDYLTIGGEYRFRQAAYDFGFFLGLGGYRIDGQGLAGAEDHSALGATLGLTGDFDLTRRLSILAELDFHYVFFDETNFYGAALVGVAVHF